MGGGGGLYTVPTITDFSASVMHMIDNLTEFFKCRNWSNLGLRPGKLQLVTVNRSVWMVVGRARGRLEKVYFGPRPFIIVNHNQVKEAFPDG